MASIDALTSSTSSIRGYGGLASGLDRDTLIEQLTAGTQAKIDKANQDKTKLEWEQEAIRAITDMMYDFTQKYTSYSSSTNLLGSAFYGRTDITANGANSKYVSVTGSTNTAQLMTVLGVKQLAQAASLKTNGNVSDRTLNLGEISMNMDDVTDVNVVGGGKIYIEYGSTKYTVTLGRGEGYSYGTTQEIADSINKSLGEVTLASGKTLAEVMNVSVYGDKLMIENNDAAGNTISVKGGSTGVLEALGFNNSDGYEIGARLSVVADSAAEAIQEKSIASQLAGQSISFEYNGTVKWIGMPTEDELKGKSLSDVQAYLQKELNSAFGNGRIEVGLTQSADGRSGSLTFKTTVPTTNNKGEVVPGAEDTTSTLAITAATGYLMGEDSLFGTMNGESNRLNLNATLAEAGLANTWTSGNGAELIINGKKIDGITEDSTIQDIINAVNNDTDAGVTISYEKNTDRFVITSKQEGASGYVTVSGNVADALFGTKDAGYTVQEGKDAVIAVQYAGSGEVTEIVRGTNTVSVDGLNITVNGTFGYDENDQLIADTEAVTFTAKVDTDKVVDTVKSMVDEFNKILEHVNTQVSTKPDRDYSPLTSSQKSELSEDEIKLWEEKAKEGLLFMDTDIRGLADALRFTIPDNLRTALENIGITVSTDYEDNGKLVLDESKLRAAVESDPEAVREALAESVQTNDDGTKTKGGLITNMKNIMDKYASTTGATKGILVERAGSTHSPTSMLKNSLLTQINEIDDRIETLKDRLSTEQDRYISQFTMLETLVAQMNSQSSYLSQLMA